ncbi:BTAD domain-containing putative transcriptional regulator [Rathayibacter sp. YIM 133350]|uniref:nSTAND1 domain-containing NTPase n=1 Tax=Rathayibacter sp. YIM 133350 TaxID=3131992 RepID=UPI00307DCBBB
MDVRVLGPLIAGEASLSPRERSVLAALVVRAPESIDAATLSDAVWGAEPPATWAQQVKTSIAQIRRALGAGAVRTDAVGYALGLDAESIDARRFERLVAAARSHAAYGEADRAADALDRALALWHGRAFADLASWEPATAEADRLAELRRSAEEELLDARLACGEHRSVIADAERLLREAPLREHRWAVLALADYRSGRQAEALATLRSARERLADELGVDPGRELVDLEQAMLRQDPALDPAPVPPRANDTCPYRGLAAYAVGDAEFFFGREAEIAALLERLGAAPPVVVAGASGSGKSSTVLAGLVPELRRRARDVQVIRPDALGVVAMTLAVEAGDGAIVVVDQLEEAFALGDADAGAFTTALGAAASAGVPLVATVRSDFLDRIASTPALEPLLVNGVTLIGPMSREALRRAIEEPARVAGLRLESGLAELILRDASGQPAALPHLSHALVEAWLRREGRTLTVGAYEASGGIVGAIAQSADRLYRSLDASERELCRATFLRLVSRGPDGQAVRRRMLTPPLREDAARDALIDRLERARLVTAESDSIAVAHEAIAEAWPRLAGWLDEDAEGARVLGGLVAAAEEWNAGGRSPEDLYRGARLQTAIEWRERTTPDLTPVEAGFLDASALAARTELGVLEARAAREVRQGRTLRAALVGATAAFVVAAIAAGVATSTSAEARRSADDAALEALMSTSLASRSSDRDVAALLAAELYRRAPDDPRSRIALMGSMTAAGGYIGSTYVEGASDGVAGGLIPGTDEAFVMRDHSSAAIIDVETGAEAHEVDLPVSAGAYAPYVGIRPDGRYAVVVGATEDAAGAAFVDLQTFATTGPVAVTQTTDGAGWLADGRFAAIETASGILTVLDPATGRADAPATIAGFRAPVGDDVWTRAAVTADGMLVVSTPGRIELVDLVSRRVVRGADVSVGATTQTLATDGGIAVSSGPYGLAALDLASGAVLWERDFALLEDWQCLRLVVDAENDRFFCASDSGLIEERDLRTGLPTGRRIEPQVDAIAKLELSDDGTEVIAYAAQAPVIVRWRVDGSGPASDLVVGGRLAVGAGFDPSGRYLMTSTRPDAPHLESVGGDTVIWDLSAEAPLNLDLVDGTEYFWAGDGALLEANRDGRFGVLDVATGQRRIADWAAEDWRNPTASRDGERLYVPITDGDVYTVDPTTGHRLDTTFVVPGRGLVVSDTLDGSRVAVTYVAADGSGFATRIFDGQTGEPVAEGPPGDLGTEIAGDELIGSGPQRLTRYRLDDLTAEGTLPRTRAAALALTASNDGGTLLVAARDQSVAVYDLAAGARLGDRLQADAPNTVGGYLAPDGAAFVLNAAEGVVQWSLDPEDHFRAACRLAGRELTQDEWETYLHDFGPRRDTCAALSQG